MRWLDPPGRPKLPKTAQIRLLRLAVEQRPGDAALHVRLGEALTDFGDSAGAVPVLETARQLDPAAFRRHDSLSEGYFKMGRFPEALDAAERGLDLTPERGELHYRRGAILQSLGEHGAATAALLTAVQCDPNIPWAVERLMIQPARDPDPGRLLAMCDAVSAHYADSTVMRGWRALGLSRLGRRDDAMALIDLDRHVASVRFEPPAEFGGLDRFNATLAAEIAGNPDFSHDPELGFLQTEALDTVNARAFPVLARFIRGQCEAFMADWRLHGLARRPEAGTLWTAGHMLRGDQLHAPHLHKLSIVSGAYYVAAPPGLGVGDQPRGALRMGAVDELGDGAVPCWGVRTIAPVPGTLVIFASQVFHTVTATHTDQPRVAVTFDVRFPPSNANGIGQQGVSTMPPLESRVSI